MDDTRRAIVGGVAGVLMVGGIAWTSSWYFAPANRSLVDLIPAVAMFVMGVAVIVWVFRGPRRKTLLLVRLSEALAEGYALEAHPGFDFEMRERRWSTDVAMLLYRSFGGSVSDSFDPAKQGRTPGNTGGLSGVHTWQLEQLKVIRDGVEQGTVLIVRGR